MNPDFLAALVRGVGFIGLFQSCGGVLYLTAFGDPPTPVSRQVNRAVVVAAAAAWVCFILQQSLEAARFVGEFSGMLDPDMQRLAWSSSAALAQAVRLVGLLMIVVGMAIGPGSGRLLAGAGAIAALLSFPLTGHTSVHSWRGVLAPLLGLHVLIAAFWFGSLLPLYLLSREETRAYAAGVLERFSATAAFLVPLIAIAGIVLALALAAELAVLQRPYGQLLLAKLAAFAVLMGLAAYNKWRLVPAVRRGDSQSLGRLRRSIASEGGLIVGVLAVTAILTLFFSPRD